ncbi:MAG: tetratricopeptide repeat protein [Candidatus Latescibacteria bacterium]|nr:tetratricopeptide repeat protein [Candidatus Latescibacterota bacterium]
MFPLLILFALLAGCAAPVQRRPFSSGQTAPQKRAMHYFVKAKVAEEQKDYNPAIVALRNAADLDPTSPTILSQLAYDYEEMDDFLMAEAFSRRALKLDPKRLALRYLRFRIFERQGHHPQAAGELEAILDLQPDNWPLYSILARLYLEAGQQGRITRTFNRMLSHDNAPADARADVAAIFARLGRQQRAEAIYRQLIAEDPQTEEAWLGLAEIFLARGQRQEAIRCYRQAAQLLPDSPHALYELAQLLAEIGSVEEVLHDPDLHFLYRLGVTLAETEHYDMAARIFEHIVGQGPTTVEGWLEPARYYLHIGDHGRVGQVMSQAVATMPDSSELYLFWGAALEQAARLDEAIAVYRQGLEHCPAITDLYLRWGFVLERQEQWDQAVEVYRQGLSVAPPDPQLYIRWGIVLGRQQRWQEALGRYQKAAALDSLDSETLLHWGIALQKLGQWEPAIEKLTRASELDTDDSYGLFYLGSCLEQAAGHQPQANYLTRAIEIFKQLVALNPNDSYSLNYLGYLYADRGIHLDEAVELLQRAVGIDPENSAFYDSLGWAYYHLGQLDQAKQYLDQALEKMKSYQGEEQAVIFDHAGDIAQAMGRHPEAKQHWQRALELVPENDTVQRKLSPPVRP